MGSEARATFSPRDLMKRLAADPASYDFADGMIVDNLVDPDLDLGRMTARALVSSVRVDRSSDCLDPRGCDLTDYARNPVVLYEHGKRFPFPIGKSETPDGRLTAMIVKDGVEATCWFSQKVKEAAQVFALICEKTIRAASVYMDPTRYAVRAPINPRTGRPGMQVDAWKLIEWSWCAVGDNPDALAKTLATKRINGEILLPSLWHSLAVHAPRLTNHVRGATFSIGAKTMTAPALPKDFKPFAKADEPVEQIQAFMLDLSIFPTADDAIAALQKSNYKADVVEHEHGWYAPQCSIEEIEGGAEGLISRSVEGFDGAVAFVGKSVAMTTRSGANVASRQPGRNGTSPSAAGSSGAGSGSPSGVADRIGLSDDARKKELESESMEVAGEPSAEPLGGQVLRGLHSQLMATCEVVKAHRGQLENPGVIKLVDKCTTDLEKMLTEIMGKFADLYPDAGGLDMAPKSDDLADRMASFLAASEPDRDLVKGIARTLETVGKVDTLAPQFKSALGRAGNQFAELLTKVETVDPASILDDATKARIEGLEATLARLSARLEAAVPKC